MTKDMPLGGELSLDMMYRTCGTQLNIDYNSEKDFVKKFKNAGATILGGCCETRPSHIKEMVQFK